MSAIYGGGVSGSLRKIPNPRCLISVNFPLSPDNIDKVDKAFWAIIDKVKKQGGITDADLNRARKPLSERNKVSIQKNSFWLSTLKDADVMGYNPERILNYEERLNNITPAKLTEIANKYYTKENIFTSKWLPEL